MFNDLVNKYKGLLSGGIQTLSSAIQQNPTPAGYIKKKIAPPIQQGFNQVGQAAGNIIRGPVSPLPNQGIQKIVQPVRNFAGDLVQEYLKALPSKVGSAIRVSPPAQLGQHILNTPSPKQQLGQAGNALSLALDVGTLPVAGGVVKDTAIQLGKQGLKTAVKEGAIQGAKFGGLYGGLEALFTNKDQQDLRKYVANLTTSTLTGTGVGGVGGGVLGGAGYTIGKVFGTVTHTLQDIFPGKSEKELLHDAKGFFRDELGRFSGKQSKDEPIFYGDLRESLGLPRNGDYQSGFVKPDEFLPKGKKTIDTQLPFPEGQGGQIQIGEKVKQKGKLTTKPFQQAGENSSLLPQGRSSLSRTERVQPELQPPSLPNSSTDIIPQRIDTKPQTLNVNNLQLTPEQKLEVAQQGRTLRTKLGDKQITEIAKNVGIDTKSHSIDETAGKIAEQLNLRRNVVSLENEFTAMKQQGSAPEALAAKLQEIDRASRISAEQGTDIARQLRARKILANELDTPMQRIFKLLQNAGINPNEYTQKAVDVDFSSPDQVVSFYRSLVPPKAGEWIDQLRYNSMLSSPNTHINNAFSNLLNTGVVAPIEKTVTGAIDFLSSPFRGGQRNAFVSEGPAYMGGYVSKVGEAAHKFADVMRGVSMSKNLDTQYIPVANGGVKGAVAKTLDLPMRLLEASDQFFTTLTAGGEEAALKLRQGRGVNVGDIASQAQDNAAYRLYRGELNDPKQGGLLKGIDHLTGLIQRARNDKTWVGTVAKFTLPFVKTPMNILKQMIEYSPAGVATIPGAINKTEQLSKAIIGTSAAMGAAMLVGSGRTTWAEPTDAKKKAAFRAAGMQPYSVKIGDNWVSYLKLPPALAANLALISAIHDAQDNKRLNDSDVQNILDGVAKWGNFFADQSYLKQIGDLVSAAKGSPEAITQFVSNYHQQLVPFRALSGWVARIIDPYQRKVDTNASVLDKQIQQLMMNIPGLSQQVPAREDQYGKPIENQNRVLNAVSPLRVTTEKPGARQEYDVLQQKARDTRLENDLRDQVKQTHTTQTSGTKIAFTDSKGKVRVIDTSFQPTRPKLTGNTELDKKLVSKYNSEITSKVNDIVDLYEAGKMSATDAEKAISEVKSKAIKAGKKTPKPSFRIKSVKVPKIKLSKVKKIKVSRLKQSNPIALRLKKVKQTKVKLSARLSGKTGGDKLPKDQEAGAQKNNYYCGPASLQYVLKKQDVNIDQDTLAKKLDTTKSGTDDGDLIRVAKELGFDPTVYENMGGEETLQALKGKTAILDYVMGSDMEDDGHFAVYIDSDTDSVTLWNPWDGKTEKRDKESFISKWVGLGDAGHKEKYRHWAMSLT